MKNTNKTPYLKIITQAIGRYQLTLFFVLTIVGLSVAVITLNSIVVQSSNTTGLKSSLENSGFDQTTINRINQLQSSNVDPVGFSLPSGRISPFAE
ncbi:MAG: hypothetical protein ABI716_01585 [Candidatus Saccharibacteria bacterium]